MSQRESVVPLTSRSSMMLWVASLLIGTIISPIMVRVIISSSSMHHLTLHVLSSQFEWHIGQ